MVTAGEAAGLLFLVALNSAIAALITRFLRVRLHTRWGSAVYTVLAVPTLLTVTTLLLGAFLGPDLGGPATVVAITIVTPFAIGVTFDYVWMPAPDEVTLPDQYDSEQVRRNS